ncbi:unnamed protein product [Closterium sp. NIES-64]|nr:unnamed protein product [Closterium sp. NIES-64]
MGADRRPKNPVQIAVWWLKKQPPKIKAFLGVCIGIAALIFLRFMVVDHDNLFVAAEASMPSVRDSYHFHLGLSLKSQELTAIFLAVRLYCSMMMEKDIHTLLDLATLVTTAWVIYTMRFQLRSTLSEDLDNLAHVYILAACAILALLVHPRTSHFIVNRVLWAFPPWPPCSPSLRLVPSPYPVLPIFPPTPPFSFPLLAPPFSPSRLPPFPTFPRPPLPRSWRRAPILALLVHPRTSHFIVNRVLWAFCVYLEAVSVLPQLRVMQNAKNAKVSRGGEAKGREEGGAFGIEWAVQGGRERGGVGGRSSASILRLVGYPPKPPSYPPSPYPFVLHRLPPHAISYWGPSHRTLSHRSALALSLPLSHPTPPFHVPILVHLISASPVPSRTPSETLHGTLCLCSRYQLKPLNLSHSFPLFSSPPPLLPPPIPSPASGALYSALCLCARYRSLPLLRTLDPAGYGMWPAMVLLSVTNRPRDHTDLHPLTAASPSSPASLPPFRWMDGHSFIMTP